MATHRVFLAVSPEPLAILIALVAGDYHDAANRRGVSRGLKHMSRSHDVGGISLHRLAIGAANQWLRRVMNQNLRAVIKGLRQFLLIPDVPENGDHVPVDR